MTRALRLDSPDYFYHIINRSNFKLEFFSCDNDYIEFIKIIRESLRAAPVKIYAYCLMPNHWHFLISPYEVGGISKFMHMLSNTHTRRFHSKTDTIGCGPLYQGRYKSMPIDNDVSFLKVFRYIEKNPVRAGLTITPKDWPWGSAWLREKGNKEQQLIVENVPNGIMEDFGDFYNFINLTEDQNDINKIRRSITRGTPFGREKWVDAMVKMHGLESTVRQIGRQRKC